ncbi:Putative peptidoglycan binding domain-containing protein [Streptomyces zhaozhouensis]|uniref:Peptidoglycan binding domain-containing protein n=1 Tax=Streptomyces zhaozhouensis TaxID=1300267 RepID=A0A286DZD8_9ACTN|nr:peptidoglycan-binding domain-containing protein [Streptomyces zhaozhouensis]SOD64032.1 Putative peptidoglycan binding domain-containing protein [Streptomyces zhaozhouensis]
MRHVFRSTLALAVLLVGVGLAPAATAATAATPAAESSAAPAAPTCRHTDTHPLLAYGSAGPEVAHAQCLLRTVHGIGIDVDGIFGPKTEAAVFHVQKKCDIGVDGIVGTITWKVLHSGC